jgi:lysophospholipase L1-like esterase
MKKIVVILLLVTVTFSVAAQTNSWDSTFRPNGYVLKLSQFKSYANSSTDVVFLGNSITAGTDWNELLGLKTARNRGISGDITFGILERLDEITEGKPARIFILIGINDISRNIPDSVIIENYKKIIRRVKAASPATRIYFQTLMPVNNEYTAFKNHYNKDEHILFVNETLKKMASTEKITVIDLYPHFLNQDGKMEKKYTTDGLHLNAAGYQHWASILKPYLK